MREMRILHLYMLLLLFGLGYSCKKKSYPESTTNNDATFYFRGSVDNKAYSIDAGYNDYYMYSSYGKDANNVNNFVGELRNSICGACERFELVINDYKVSPAGTPSDIASSLHTGKYQYFGKFPLTYLVVFNSTYNKTPSTYLWDFGDGQSSNSKDPVHSYAKKGIYNVCLTITSVNGCVSNICNQVKVRTGTSASRTTISATATAIKKLQFNQTSTGALPILNYLWDFGDGTQSTVANPSHTYQVDGAYPVSLRITDSNNDVATAHYNAITQNDMSSCAANFIVQSITEEDINADPLGLSTVQIKWVDARGVVYTSDNTLQPASDYFEILSVEDYELNENNQKTKKLHIKFKTTVYNGTNAINISNGDAVMAVAYQE